MLQTSHNRIVEQNLRQTHDMEGLAVLYVFDGCVFGGYESHMSMVSHHCADIAER